MKRISNANSLFVAIVAFVVSAFIFLLFFGSGGSNWRLTYSGVSAVATLPFGNLGIINASGNLQGWAIDPDVPTTSIMVNFYVDGPMGAGVFAGTVLASVPRSDVNAATGYPGDHGFIFSVPFQYWDGKQHVMYAYGVDSASPSTVALLNNQRAFTIQPPPMLTINPWDYVLGNPNVRLCNSTSSTFCFSRAQTAANRSVNRRTDGAMGMFELNPIRMGVVKDGGPWGDITSTSTPWLRCFGDAPGSCNASYPPFYMPLSVSLPILPASAMNPSGITAGAKALSLFNTTYVKTYVNPINANTCAISPQTAGSIVNSNWAYIMDSYNFGGTIGAKKNVLVHESTGGYPPGTADPTSGVRMERYFLVPGLGHVRAEGQGKLACRASSTIQNCSGNFSLDGLALWNGVGTPGIPVFESCAPGATGAKMISQSWVLNGMPINPANGISSGAVYTVKFVVQNTGGAVWTKLKNYRLGSPTSQNNAIWGMGRGYLSDIDAIKPGEQKTFTITITAPKTPGTYPFQWQMVQELVEWFGETTKDSIVVR